MVSGGVSNKTRFSYVNRFEKFITFYFQWNCTFLLHKFTIFFNWNNNNIGVYCVVALLDNKVITSSALSATGGVGFVPTLVSEPLRGEVDMVQEGEGGAGGEGLIAPRRLPNPCMESPQRMDLHRELLFNQRIGKNVLNQKSELEKALSKHKEKQIMNQVKEHRETPELERAIAERARRLEQAEQSSEEIEAGTNPTLQEVRARLRHAAPAPAASAH